MECFVHSPTPAIGICKTCGKGVCRSCVIPLERGLACSEECKSFALSVSRWQTTAMKNIGLLAAQRFAQPMLAVISLVGAIYLSSQHFAGSLVFFFYGLAAVFVLISAMSWLRSRG